MQVQLEVCDLNECDFLETRFIEYPDLEAFNEDIIVNPETKKGLYDAVYENGQSACV